MGTSTLLPESTSEQIESIADQPDGLDSNEINVNLDEALNGPIPDPFLDSGPYSLQDIHSPLDFSALDLLFPHVDSDILKAERLEHLAYFTSSLGMSTFADKATFRCNQKLVADDYEDSTERTRADPHSETWTAKTLELTSDLQNIVTNKRNDDVIAFDWTPTTQIQCQEFFAPANIQRFLEYFWSLWYPNCPIVHRPLFDPFKAPTTLLCVMTIIGACLSPTQNDVQRARQWLDSTEELIFSHNCFRDAKPYAESTQRKEVLQIAQAGYLICSLQKREGSGETQARIRRYRHASMVTVRGTPFFSNHKILTIYS